MAKIVTLIGKEGYDSSVEMYPQTVFQAVRDASTNKTLQTLTDELVDANNYININDVNDHPTGYPGRATAVSYVPLANRKAGLCVTYKDASQGNKWIDAQFIGSPSDVSTNWTSAANWQNIGPVDSSVTSTNYKITLGDSSVNIPAVSVSQNTSTGHTDISVGGVTTPVASVEEVSQLGQELNGAENHIKTLADKLNWHIGSFYSLQTGIITVPIFSYVCSDVLPIEFEPLISNIGMVGTQTTGITRNSHKSLYLNDTYVGYLRHGEFFTPQGESVSSIEYNYFAINEYTVSEYNPSYDTYYVIFSLAKAKAKAEKISFDKGFYALGDSTTFGAGSTTGNTSWANILTTLAGFSNFTKLAANGAFCMYHPNYARLSTQIASVPSNYAGIITIMIGTNDFMQDSPLGDSSVTMSKAYGALTDTDNFADSFRYNLETLKRKCPDAIILCITPLPSRDAGNEHGHWDETNLFAIRQIERDICNAMGIPIIESAKEFGLSRYVYDWYHFYSDFLHPNDLGYERIAHCMLGKFVEFCQ